MNWRHCNLLHELFMEQELFYFRMGSRVDLYQPSSRSNREKPGVSISKKKLTHSSKLYISTSKVHHESFHQQIEALLALSYILSPYFVFWWLLDLLGVLNSHILTEYYLVMLGLTPEEIFWTVGVTNVFLSAWLAGAFPYCYWIFHIFKFGSLLLLRCYKSL